MTTVKSMRIGAIIRAQQEPPSNYYFVTALGYFDLLEPDDFDLETKMWPTIAGALGSTPIDVGMPKPRGEVLLAGYAMTPGGKPVTQMRVELAFGPVRKRLVVFGDRYWELTRDGPAFTSPLPFTQMPLAWDRAFGGPGFAANPVGTGYAARKLLAEGRQVRLPNLEDDGNLILDVEHTPHPVGFGFVDIMAPSRQRFAGAYDDDWLKRRHPGHAFDFDWTFYNAAPADQWTTGFLLGDERIRIAGMHADHPLIDSRLPGMRVRAFLNLQRDTERVVQEVEMRCETVVLFPNQLKGVVVYRGGCNVSDIDGKDVIDTLLAYERLVDAPRSSEHYVRTLKLRTDPETAALSFFDEKPLRPDIPEAELAEREAERSAAVEERDLKWEKRFEAGIAAAYDAVGALPPPLGSIPKPKLPFAIPAITPGDIKRMDVDMTAVMKAFDDLKAYGETQIAEGQKLAAKAMSEVQGMLNGPGGKLVDSKTLAKISAAAAGLPPVPTGEAPLFPADFPTPETMQKTLADIPKPAGYKDPFEAIIEAAEAADGPLGPLTEAEQALLRARAEGRPEAGLAASLLKEIDNVDLSMGGMVDPKPPADKPASAGSFEALLEQIGGIEGGGDAAKGVNDAIAGLGTRADLLRPLLAAKTPEPEGDADDALEKTKAAIAGAGPKLEEALAEGRRMSPEPLAPMEPMRAEECAYLGQVVRECLAAGGDLTGRDWAGAALAGADFSGRDLRGAFFERADLANADFQGANLEGAVFTGAVLTGADFSDCTMRGANLSKVEARGARFARSDLTDARLMFAQLAEADLSATTIENATALEVDLTRADLSNAQLTTSTFIKAKLDEAVLDGAEFQRCAFLQATMDRLSARGTRFERSALVACTQRDGDYTGADFTGTGSVGGAVYDGSVMRDLVAPRSGWNSASMVGVDLHAALLDGADLMKANLTGARLTRASLRRALLIETVLAGADASAATLAEAAMRRSDLRGASLRHANLYRADIDATDLTDCDLTGVNKLGTNFLRAADVPG